MPLLSAAARSLPDPQAAHYLRALDKLADRPDDAISLSVTLPFCAAHCLCCHRDVHAAQSSSVIDDYVDGLIGEMALLSERIGAGRDVLQLHLGGGTANELSETQLARLVHALRRHWRLPADSEMSIECDPRRTGVMQLRLLRGLGFRNLIMGVLDLDPAVQRAIGRLHSTALIDDACNVARSCGIDSILLDVMIGLPGQTEESWRRTLDQLVALAPDRLSLKHYRHQPWLAPAQYAIDPDGLPNAEERQRLAMMAAAWLCEAGYRWIGADQFVLEGDELATALDQGRLRRNLIAYTATPVTPQLGLGAGAIGEVDGNVFWNDASLPDWRHAVRQGRLPVARAREASEREIRRRAAVEHLLCRLELPAALADDGLEDLYDRLASHAATGAVRVLDDRIQVTDSGRHALFNLCLDLDRPSPDDDLSTPVRSVV